jgi:BolA protein
MNESTIYNKLHDFFKPEVLEVTNDSEKHKGHSGSPNSGNSHFSVIIKSDKLKGLGRVSGQRAIHKVLEKDLSEYIHALSIKII